VKPDVKRGLNRIFVVLTAIWVLYCLLGYPFQKRIEAVKKQDANMKDCYGASHDVQKDCYATVQQIYLNEVTQYEIPGYYEWSWPFLLVVAVGLPIVAYLICFTFIATLVWVSRGFKPV
jgi:hypothetical protein